MLKRILVTFLKILVFYIFKTINYKTIKILVFYIFKTKSHISLTFKIIN